MRRWIAAIIAVDCDDGAIDERGFVGGKEHSEFPDFIRRAQPALRHNLRDFGNSIGVVPEKADVTKVLQKF